MHVIQAVIITLCMLHSFSCPGLSKTGVSQIHNRVYSLNCRKAVDLEIAVMFDIFESR